MHEKYMQMYLSCLWMSFVIHADVNLYKRYNIQITVKHP